MAKTTTEEQASVELFFKDHPELDTPEFRAGCAKVKAGRLAKQQRDAEVLEAYRARPKPKFSELPFVGKKYRSRNRRSADKSTAWAVKPELGEMAAMQGYEYARQFLHHINAKAHDELEGGCDPWAGFGVSLENIVLGMADTLASCKPSDKDSHLRVIRGFCSVMEIAAIQALDSFGMDEKFNADTYQIRMAHLDTHKPYVFDCNARPWVCEVEKRLMLEATHGE